MPDTPTNSVVPPESVSPHQENQDTSSGEAASSTTPEIGAPMPYAEITDASYATKASRFRIVPTRGGVILSGPCPRCADAMLFPHVDKSYRRFRLTRPDAPARPGRRSTAEQDPIPMVCTCTGDHPGRPPGEDGCGAYWNVVLGLAE